MLHSLISFQCNINVYKPIQLRLSVNQMTAFDKTKFYFHDLKQQQVNQLSLKGFKCEKGAILSVDFYSWFMCVTKYME